MYGMVNKAVQDLIVSHHGEEVWLRVREAAEVEDEVFMSNQQYPDEVTYRLVGAVSQVLNIPAAEVLEQFGKHWVLVTARRGYGQLLKLGGRTLKEFLVNLPNLHTRIAMMFQDLQPPEFECSDVAEDGMRLHYRSHRPGLAPFVQGLLMGLSELFETPAVIRHEQKLAEGADHDVFYIGWGTSEKETAA